MKRKNRQTTDDDSQPPVAKVARQESDPEDDEELMDMSQRPDCPSDPVRIFDTLGSVMADAICIMYTCL
jgi:hypothetical protein